VGSGGGVSFLCAIFKILIGIRSEVELIEQRAGDPPSRKASIYAKAATRQDGVTGDGAEIR